MRTRQEHLDWCKQRALEYWRAGNLKDAVASMGSDMSKHPDTRTYPTVLDHLAVLYLINNDSDGVKRWIEGFR